MYALKYSMLTLTWTAIAAAPLLAQSEREYVRFRIDKNVEALVKQRLQTEKDLGPLKDLVRQIMADPKKFHLDPKQFKDLKLEDQKVKQAFEHLLKNDPELQKSLRKWVQQNQSDQQPDKVRKSLKELDQILKQKGLADNQPKTPEGRTPPSAVKSQDSAKPKIAASPNTVEQMMKKVQNSNLGHWLQDSPAWKQAFKDLRSSLDKPTTSPWKLGDLPSQWLAPDSKAWKLGEETLDRLKNMPRPDLERWNMNLSVPGLGNIPTPNLGPPALPPFTGPTLPSMSTAATWLVFALLCVFAGLQIMRWSRRAPASVDARAVLGPWPVAPERVTTRAELVQAFDYLALLTLGLQVRSWNHQAIARGWCQAFPSYTPSAQLLARLYEQARYTDGVETLSEAQRNQVRQSLRQLAEAM